MKLKVFIVKVVLFLPFDRIKGQKEAIKGLTLWPTIQPLRPKIQQILKSKNLHFNDF